MFDGKQIITIKNDKIWKCMLELACYNFNKVLPRRDHINTGAMFRAYSSADGFNMLNCITHCHSGITQMQYKEPAIL